MIQDDIEKGYLLDVLNVSAVTGDDDAIQKAFGSIIEKGKKANVGEIREWGGKKFRKEPAGWIPVKPGNWIPIKGDFPEEDKKGGDIPEDIKNLIEHKAETNPDGSVTYALKNKMDLIETLQEKYANNKNIEFHITQGDDYASAVTIKNGSKTEKPVKSEKTGISTKDLKKTISKSLVEISEPQEGCFIGAYDLCSGNIKSWKKQISAEAEDVDLSKETLANFFTHFEANIKGKIVDEGDFFDDDDQGDEGGDDLEDKFEMEHPYKVAKLKGTQLTAPKGMDYFMILPVDFNRSYGSDIGVAYMTEEGKKLYSKHLTGDY